MKTSNAGRYLLAFFILFFLIITQASRGIANLTNNLGSVKLNRALLSGASPEARLASFSAAGVKFQQALNRDPGIGFAYYNLGAIYMDFKDTQFAHEAFTGAASMMPGDPLSAFQLGLTKAALGDEAGAITVWRQARAAPYFLNSALVYSREGELESAVRDAQRAISIDPLWLAAYHALSDLYIKEKDYESALQVSQTAVSIAPDDVDSLQRLGEALHRAGKDEQAAGVYRRALLLSPEHAPTLHALASIYAEGTACEQAGRVLQPLLNVKAGTADTARALRLLGKCYVNRQNPGYALPYLERLAVFDKATLKDLGLLAQTYAALDLKSAAVDVYNHILLLDPDNEPAQQALAGLKGEGP